MRFEASSRTRIRPCRRAFRRSGQKKYEEIELSWPQELNSFLLKCFEKSSVDRPGAAALLDDPWIQGNKRRAAF